MLERPKSDRVAVLARTGAVWSLGLTFLRYLVSLGGVVVLSRLLTPGDYGIAGMATTVIAFSQMFSDAGLGWATIQRSDVTEEQVNNLFWVNGLLGVVLWGVAVLSGPALNAFFRRSHLAPIAAVAGITLFLNSLSVQPMATLRRQMRIRILSLAEICSLTLGAIAGIIAAVNGWGYWSLIVQTIANQLVLCCLVFPVSGFRIKRPKLDLHTRGFIAFGGFLTGYSILSYFAKNIDNLLIGRMFGPEQLGLYARAYFLMTLPGMFAAGGLQYTMVPALAALRSYPDAFDALYRRGIKTIAYIAFPMSAGLGVTSHELVGILYGPNWIGVAPLLSWLSIGGLCISLHTFSWLYMVCGRERELFRWGFLPPGVLVVAFSIGLHWGTPGMAVAYALAMSLIITPAGFYFAHRNSEVRLAPVLKDLIHPLFATALMVISVLLAKYVTFRLNVPGLASFVIELIVAVTAYGTLCRDRIRDLWHGDSLEPQLAVDNAAASA